MSPPGMKETWSLAFSPWQSSETEKLLWHFNSLEHFNSLLQHQCSGHYFSWPTPDPKKRKHKFCEKACHREVITVNPWCYWLHNLRTEFLVAGEGSPAKVLVFSPSPCAQGPWTGWRSTPPREYSLHSRHLLLVWADLKTEVTAILLLSNH